MSLYKQAVAMATRL